MLFLVSEEISEIINERNQILRDLNNANSKATLLHKYLSQIAHEISNLKPSEQIPTQLTREGTPPAELAKALSLLQVEFAETENIQGQIKSYKNQIQREKEKRRVILIGGSMVVLILIVFLANALFNQQGSTPSQQNIRVSPASTDQQVILNVEEKTSVSNTTPPSRAASPTKIATRMPTRTLTSTKPSIPEADSTAVRQRSISTPTRSSLPTSTKVPTRTPTASRVPPTVTPTKSPTLPQFVSGTCLPNKCHLQGFTGGLLISAYGKTFGLFNSGQ